MLLRLKKLIIYGFRSFISDSAESAFAQKNGFTLFLNDRHGARSRCDRIQAQKKTSFLLSEKARRTHQNNIGRKSFIYKDTDRLVRIKQKGRIAPKIRPTCIFRYTVMRLKEKKVSARRGDICVGAEPSKDNLMLPKRKLGNSYEDIISPIQGFDT